MVTGGIDLVSVSEILGHSDITMTMRYAHPTPENKRRAVEALAAVFGTQRDDNGTIQTQYSRKPNMISSLPTN